MILFYCKACGNIQHLMEENCVTACHCEKSCVYVEGGSIVPDGPCAIMEFDPAEFTDSLRSFENGYGTVLGGTEFVEEKDQRIHRKQ